MKKNKKVLFSDNTEYHFLSLDLFREAHSKLLRDHITHGDTSKFFSEVIEYVHSGKKLGELLDSSNDRWAAQSIIDYWATVLFRADYDAPDVILAEFNIKLAPDLSDVMCPYRGLSAFQEEDRDNFFGRQKVIDDLIEKLRGSRLACIVGSSGSGKSSLVRAGLLPLLKSGGIDGSQNWNYYAPILPGSNPLENLVSAIHPPKKDREIWIKKQTDSLYDNPKQLGRLIDESGLDVATVLVIDQFEEVFTLCSDETLRLAFVNNLSMLIKKKGVRHTVIITMRIDFLEHLSQMPGFQPLFRQNTFILPKISPDEIREVIESPARRTNLKFEEDVVDSLISDVRDDRTPLPLLQFALINLWDNKERNRVTIKTYENLGGAKKVLSTVADRLYGDLRNDEKTAIMHVLVKLCRQPEKGEEVTRDRLSLKRLYNSGIARDRIEWALDKLIKTHLVSITEGDTDDDTLVEIAHEALVRDWEPLIEKLYEDRINIRRRRQLTQTAYQWDATGRDSSILWRGVQLDSASVYKDLDPVEGKFLQASYAAIEAEKEQEIAQRLEIEKAKLEAENERENARKERETTEKFRKLNQKLDNALSQATKERDRAEKQARLAFSRELAAAAINNLNVDPERSILLAMNAVSLTFAVDEKVAPEAEDALHRALQTSRVMLSFYGHTDQVRSLAFSPDGKRLATASSDKTVKIWDLASGKELLTLSGHTDGVLDVAFSPDGTYLASASRDKTARVWHIDSGRVKRIFKHEKEIYRVAFSPINMSLATASADATAKVWDIATGKMTWSLDDHNDVVTSVTFSPDGTRLATASRDKTVKIWDAKYGDRLANLIEHIKEVIDVAFSPDAKYLVTVGLDNIKIWETRPNREKPFSLPSLGRHVRNLAFSSDGKYLATGSEDGTATVLDFQNIGSRPEVFKLAGHSNRIYKVAFSLDGAYLATASRDGVVKIWDASPLSREVFTFIGHEREITSAKFNLDGARLVTTSLDKTAKIWDFGSRQLLHTLAGHTESVTAISFSPDGKCLATAGSDAKIIVWDAKSDKILYALPAHSDRIVDVIYSLDGKFLATASVDGSAKIWDAEFYTLIYELKHAKVIYGIAFSPNGRNIATASEDRTVKIWDISSGEEVISFHHHTRGIRSVAFSPDGTRLLTGSNDNTAKILNLSSGQVLHTLMGHTERVIDVSFSPDGKQLATASERTVKIWEAESGQEILTLSGTTDNIRSVAFDPSGRYLVSASQGGIIRVYTLPVENLLSLARDRVTRSLRPDECQKYLHLNDYLPVLSSIDGGVKISALWLVVHGKNLARGGDILGAIASFRKAQELDSGTVDFDPETEALRLGEHHLPKSSEKFA